MQTYYSELAVRFHDGYDPAVSPVADTEMTSPAGLLLVASLHDEPVGCGALIFYPDDVGLVKRMWVARSVRGLGLGRRLLAELEDRGRARCAAQRRRQRMSSPRPSRCTEPPVIAKSPPSTTSPMPTIGSKSR